MFTGRAVAMALGAALSGAPSSGLRLPDAKPQATHTATQADVDALRAKLVAVESGFEGMGAMARPDVGPFVKELEDAMAATDYVPGSGLPDAFARLEAVSVQVPKYMALMLSAPAALSTTVAPPIVPTTTRIAIPKPKVPVEAPSADEVDALRQQLASVEADALAPTTADVELLRSQLEAFERGLAGVLHSNLGALSKAQAEPELKAFHDELVKVLAKTRPMSPADAAKRLRIAQDDATRMTAKLTARQEALMNEAEAQEESLLLGELMTLQKAPMADQRSVCEHASFADLPICKALLAVQNDTVPLYVQAEDFLHGVVPEATLDTVVSNTTRTAKEYFDHVSLKKTMTASMEQRLISMDKEFATRAKVHERRSEQLEDALKRSTASSQVVMQGMVTRERESYASWTKAQSSDIATLRSALAALKHDDAEAAVRCLTKLKTPMRDFQDAFKVFALAKDRADARQK